MQNENKFKVRGVIYSKNTETVQGKKDPTQSYQKLHLVLEVKEKGYKKRGEKDSFVTTTNLIKFECFSPRFDVANFYKLDPVEIDFYIEGKEYIKKQGDRKGEKMLFNKNVITDIRHVDIQVGSDNKIKMTALSDIDKIADPLVDDPFPEVKTNMNPLKIDTEDDYDDQLPF